LHCSVEDGRGEQQQQQVVPGRSVVRGQAGPHGRRADPIAAAAAAAAATTTASELAAGAVLVAAGLGAGGRGRLRARAAPPAPPQQAGAAGAAPLLRLVPAGRGAAPRPAGHLNLNRCVRTPCT
jgi:hypothetical protein